LKRNHGSRHFVVFFRWFSGSRHIFVTSDIWIWKRIFFPTGSFISFRGNLYFEFPLIKLAIGLFFWHGGFPLSLGPNGWSSWDAFTDFNLEFFVDDFWVTFFTPIHKPLCKFLSEFFLFWFEF
jgi:hypothetical protein